MLSKKTLITTLVINLLTISICLAQSATGSVEENWNDFLHFMRIGRLDMAKNCAKAILESNPEPVTMFTISSKNEQGMSLVMKAKENEFDAELAQLSGKLMDLIDEGRFLRRHDPKLIVDQIKQLSSDSPRAQSAAVKRLQDAGEYAIMYIADALNDSDRKSEWPNIVGTLPKIGKEAVRPLTTLLQTDNLMIKANVITALGELEYPQSLPYLKYIIEKEDSAELRKLASESLMRINPDALRLSAAQLFYASGEDYYYHINSLQPPQDANFANIWFWDSNSQRLKRIEVDKSYFNELMAMRCCEWALKADPSFGQSIGLWIASFFKSESTGIAMPEYFGADHPDALTYATTAGPEYLHQALARAVKDNDAYVALASIEGLAVTAGEKSLLYRLGVAQPLIQALSFKDRAVRFSAAITIATAGPIQNFAESKLVTDNLSEALDQNPAGNSVSESWTQPLADSYAIRSAMAMLKLAETRNMVVSLAGAQSSLINATKDRRNELQVLAGQVLAYLNSPDAQRSIAAMALNPANPMEVRKQAFNSLSQSAKINASLLDNESIDAIYGLLSSPDTPAELRSAAAAAYGALNLPSQKVKDLILSQSKS